MPSWGLLGNISGKDVFSTDVPKVSMIEGMIVGGFPRTNTITFTVTLLETDGGPRFIPFTLEPASKLIVPGAPLTVPPGCQTPKNL